MTVHADSHLISITVDGRIAGRALPAAREGGVRVEGVSHAYRRGVDVVRDVDLTLTPGRVHCLLGDSGCGKTTLLRLVAGLEQSHRGKIHIGDTLVSGETTHVPAEKRRVGFVFQDYALFPHLSARRNVAFGVAGLRRAEKLRHADVLLERVGMAGFGKAMPHTLSGGQQQRVALARALARDPQVMLLDEPFSGLDMMLRDRVRDTTLRVLREAHVAVLMVTHDPREALVCADEVSVMRQGQIAITGRPRDICVCGTDAFGGTTVRLCTEVRAADCVAGDA